MKKKKKRKETLLIIFLVILALAIGIVAGYLVQNSEESVSGAKTQNKSEHTENISQENSETEYMVIETEYGDLLYPEQWSEYLKTEQNMEKDSLQVSFSAQLEDKNYPMFQVTIGDSEDTEVGELTDDSGIKRKVHMKVDELEGIDELTEVEQQRIYAMQEDLNYIIDNLK